MKSISPVIDLGVAATVNSLQSSNLCQRFVRNSILSFSKILGFPFAANNKCESWCALAEVVETQAQIADCK